MENDAGEKNQTVEATLAQRGTRYGEFVNHSELSCHLREEIFKHHKKFGATPVTQVQKEAIFMICHKLARIANGDPSYDDSWRDIAGYAQLVVDDLNK